MSEPRKYIIEIPSFYKPSNRRHPAYGQWSGMVNRCTNKNHSKYADYGGRGISVCERWRTGCSEFTGFECFMLDMGNKPSSSHSLDRINNSGNYEPNNCRWATNSEQANNRRSNHVLEYRGEKMSMMALSKKTGISYYVLRNRISRGWPVEDSVHQPFGTAFFDPKIAKGSALPQAKLDEIAVLEIRRLHASGEFSMMKLAIKFAVSVGSICLIVNRKSWRHVK